MLIFIYIYTVFDANAHQLRECRYVHRQTHPSITLKFGNMKGSITNFPPLCQSVFFGLVATLIWVGTLEDTIKYDSILVGTVSPLWSLTYVATPK